METIVNKENKMESMKDKVIIITGGSGGMGKACAKKFLEDGSIVYIADIKMS